MRLFLGLLILSNVIVSALYWAMITGDMKEMLTYNGIWTIFLSITFLGAWLIEPYCNI